MIRRPLLTSEGGTTPWRHGSSKTSKSGARFRRDLGDIPALATNIEEIGLLHPIVITLDNTLIAGMRRLQAVQFLGWREVPVRVVDLDDVVRGEHDENVVRKDFLPSEAVAIAKALEPA